MWAFTRDRILGGYHTLALFDASSVGDSLNPDAREVIEAAWFGRDMLPDDLLWGQRERIEDAKRAWSGGGFAALSDDAILAAQAELARSEGVFVEPASAAGVAGFLADVASGTSYAGQTVVITVTGHGLKDTVTALEWFGEVTPILVDADLDAAAAAAELR